jgi:signal transduction histidine kinase
VGNLVANAIAHTPPGGSVTLRALQDPAHAMVEVSDTGRGIAPEHLPSVFDRFFRADRSRTAGRGGVGLGLSIVKSIADLHGGEVSVESQLGRGTRFTLRFPKNPPSQR